MPKKFKFLAAFLAILLVTILGCATIQDVIVPCYIPERALRYTGSKGTSFLPYTSLWDAERIDRLVDFTHRKKRLQDDLEHGFIKGLNVFHIGSAKQLRTSIFSPQGLVGSLVPTLLGGGLGALLIKRPGDKGRTS